MSNNYTIVELAEAVNQQISQQMLSNETLLNTEHKDQRSSSLLSVRRIRDYISKGLIADSTKIGKSAVYTEEHLAQLVAIRLLQSEGIPERYIQNKVDLSNPIFVQNYIATKNTTQESSHHVLNSGAADCFENVYHGNPEREKALSAIRSIKIY